MLRIEVADKNLLEMVMKRGMNCLCTIEETKCMCDEFIKQKVVGICHCGVFRKVEV